MNILTIRTDKPLAELAVYKDQTCMARTEWQAHRQLAETLHAQIINLLKEQSLYLHDLQGVVIFKGPGSFTGLRIGFTVANSLAFGLRVAVIATHGENWAVEGVMQLLDGCDEHIALPEYGSLPHITAPRK